MYACPADLQGVGTPYFYCKTLWELPYFRRRLLLIFRYLWTSLFFSISFLTISHMNLEITGKLIEKFEPQQVSERFRKREFVLEITDEFNGNVITNFAKMQLVQNKCEIIDRYNIGDMLKVNFNIRGNRWERDGKVNYITNLDAWRIEPAMQSQPGQQPQQQGYGQPQGGGGYNQQGGSGYGQNQGSGYQSGSGFSNAPQPAEAVNYNPSPESADDLPF